MTVLRNLRALFRLVRLPETAVMMAGSFVGAGMAGVGDAELGLVTAITVSTGLLFAASQAINDWHDVREDSINKPQRPVASGEITRRQALVVAVAAFLAGIGLAAVADVRFGLAALGVTATSVLYTLVLKRVPLLGNIVCGLLTAYPLWCWILLGYAAPAGYHTLIVALVILRLGAEILKTAEDTTGDDAVGIHTVATLWGERSAQRLGAVLICGSLVPCWLTVGDTKVIYLVLLIAATGLACFSISRAFFHRTESKHFIVIQRAIMVFMVVAFGFELG